MYWIEICNDGKYTFKNQTFILSTELLEPTDPILSGETDDNCYTYRQKFILNSHIGAFEWTVEFVEYLSPQGATLISQKLTNYPAEIILTENIEFQMQDGWI